MKQKSKFFALLIVADIAIFVLYGQFRSLKFEKDLKKHGKITIGKIDSIQ